MFKIKLINFSRLRNEAHYEFLVIVLDLLLRFPSLIGLIQSFLQKFRELLEQEKHLVDADKKSPLTEKLTVADKRVDKDIAGIKNAIKSALNHFDPAVVDAAKVLNVRMKVFGNIKDKPYEEESAAVQVLIDDFKNRFAAQVQIVGLNQWVLELEQAENEFIAIFNERNTEIINRPQEKFIILRKEIEGVYKKIITAIQNNLNIIDGPGPDPSAIEFAKELNEQIKYANEHAHHRIRYDIAETTVKVIDEQAYTGRQIIVIPDVWHGHKQLVLATDFNVTYKDNIAPGNAELTIHGIGDFKGQKTVTFNIGSEPEK
jgi:hypothetical protein